MSSFFYDIHCQKETWDDPAGKERLVVKAALVGLTDQSKHKQKPHFSLTATIYEKDASGYLKDVGGGCCHELIAQRFGNRFKRIEELHLSDIDGEPMHALANGLYWYRAGFDWKCMPNGFCVAQDPYQYGKDLIKGSDNHLKVLSHHLRITTIQAKELVDKNLSKEDFTAYVESQKQRWKSEALHVLALLQGKFF